MDKSTRDRCIGALAAKIQSRSPTRVRLDTAEKLAKGCARKLAVDVKQRTSAWKEGMRDLIKAVHYGDFDLTVDDIMAIREKQKLARLRSNQANLARATEAVTNMYSAPQLAKMAIACENSIGKSGMTQGHEAAQ